MMQKDIWDCGVACLAMLLGLPYPVVRSRIRYKKPIGLSSHEIRRVARVLGFPLRFSKEVDHEDIGIVVLERTGGDRHAVLYAKGTLYNPAQGEWWTDLSSYQERSRYRKIIGIFKRED